MADKKDKKDEEEKEKEKESSEEGEGGEGTAEEGDEAAAKRKKKRKLMIIAAAAIILLGGGGAGVYFSGILSGHAKVEAPDKKGKKKKKEGEEAERGTTGSSVKAVKSNPNEWVPGVVPGHEDSDTVYYNLPEFLVNLDTTNSRQTSFIKMKVTLEAPTDKDAESIDDNLPRIIDKFNTDLREMRTSDLAGSAGLYRLREDLLLRVNTIIYPSKINNVLFREIIIQ